MRRRWALRLLAILFRGGLGEEVGWRLSLPMVLREWVGLQEARAYGNDTRKPIVHDRELAPAYDAEWQRVLVGAS